MHHEWIWDELIEEDNIYDDEGRESLVDADELSLGEAGFMQGYEEAGEES